MAKRSIEVRKIPKSLEPTRFSREPLRAFNQKSLANRTKEETPAITETHRLGLQLAVFGSKTKTIKGIRGVKKYKIIGRIEFFISSKYS